MTAGHRKNNGKPPAISANAAIAGNHAVSAEKSPYARKILPGRGGPSGICGYILFESVMALSLLSMSLIVIHNGLRQTIWVREQARDYTHARFLLSNVMAKVELQPLLTQASDSGRFKGEFSRFSWKWKVSKVNIPLPPFPPNAPKELVARFKLNVPYLTKIEAIVNWTRRGQTYEVKAETLSNPEKLFIPPEERAVLGLQP